MENNSLTVHVIVKNEDMFIWYALQSILPFAQRILVYDSGSRDKTLAIIKSIRSDKIHLEKHNIAKPEDITMLRQKQIDQTETNWFWVLDGDEVYPESLCKEIINILRNEGNSLEGIAVRRFDLIGDIYHNQSETVGTYSLYGQKGHFAIRLLNKKNIPGLHMEGKYPYEGYYDNDGIEVIRRQKTKYRFTSGKLYHAMYLKRSTLGANISDTFHRNKSKVELGNKIKDADEIKKTFIIKKPEIVPNVYENRSMVYVLISLILTPIKMFKRRFMNLL